MMRFFSNRTWRPHAATISEIPTPVGEVCLGCGDPIQADDCGVSMVHMDASGDAYRPWHLVCFRRILGIEVPSAPIADSEAAIAEHARAPCLRCGHPPCLHCRTWCDRMIPDTHIACCDGRCIYPGDPDAELVTLTDWPTSEER